MADGSQELDPIPAERAREILEAAIRERLGENWDDEEQGWTRISGHDYMARLTRRGVNVDFYVDLLGNVTVEKSELSGTQQAGRLFAVLLLGLSIVIAILIVRAVSGS